MKHLLQEYNAVSSQMDSSFLSLSLEEILSPTCSLWQSPAYEQSSQVSFNTKRDIIEAYLLKNRSDEELLLLQAEMFNVVEYCGVMVCG